MTPPGEAAPPPAESLKRRFLRGSMWGMIGVAFERGLRLPISVIAARLLGKEQFGQYGMITATVNVFLLAGAFGQSLTATKFIAEYRVRKPELAGRILGLSTMVTAAAAGLCSAVIIALAPALSERMLAAPHLSGLLRVGAILLFFSAFNIFFFGALAGFEAFRSIAIVRTIGSLVSLVVMVAGVRLWGLAGLIWGSAISTAAICLMLRQALALEARRAGVAVNYADAAREGDVLWKFSIPRLLGEGLLPPVIWWGHTMIVNAEGGYPQMGIFGAVNQWQSFMSYIPGVIGNVLLPMMAAHAHENRTRLEAVNILSSWILVSLFAIPLMAWPEAIQALYGEEYDPPAFCRTLLVVALSTCIISYSTGIVRVLYVRNFVWWTFAGNLLWSAGFLPAAWWLRDEGALGLAFAYGIAYVLKVGIFLPLCMVLGLVPPGLLISPRTMLVWLALFTMAGVTWFDFGPAVRVPVTLICTAATLGGFYLIWIMHRD